jgi:hypothetical protein
VRQAPSRGLLPAVFQPWRISVRSHSPCASRSSLAAPLLLHRWLHAPGRSSPLLARALPGSRAQAPWAAPWAWSLASLRCTAALLLQASAPSSALQSVRATCSLHARRLVPAPRPSTTCSGAACVFSHGRLQLPARLTPARSPAVPPVPWSSLLQLGILCSSTARTPGCTSLLGACVDLQPTVVCDQAEPLILSSSLAPCYCALRPRRVREAAMELRSFLFVSCVQHAIVFMFLASPLLAIPCSTSPARPRRRTSPCRSSFFAQQGFVLSCAALQVRVLGRLAPLCHVCSSILSARSDSGLARVALPSMQRGLSLKGKCALGPFLSVLVI